ncbi:MAG: glycosyl hydrolase [Saprospiraceae bacterium]|nr:glycosyl hydrolase [Bacteroidia bacterium]NNE16259.1 glycosyl hydrolase [Saprospiraceae bacterium]NNL91558.1 glycosyl hydrolase [Saprospiraceae bacterium]
MKKLFLALIVICISLTSSQSLVAQKKKKSKKDDKKSEHPLDKLSISSLKFRCVGPANTSGRISDFAVNPNNPYEYYVATSSGGVWKTKNAGTTYKPIFDNEGSYSIGCVSLDPSNHNTVWVGTGENNNQRSVAYGDGVYKSVDGGASWKHMGLKNSEHIAKIIVHPENSDIIWVAAIGPLWSSGGDRGVYRSDDGGETWTATLEIDKHTGATDLIIDPRNPDVLYAATLQRARHVFTYLGGGPGSGIYKSTDGGLTWNKSQKGLPSVDLGRIGLSISPANPEIIYAIVEAAKGKSGFYKSTNRGASWQKQSSHTTSGNYYQEIISDPVDENTIYSMDTWMKSSNDGGKSFQNVGEDTKHVDNHCMWINPQNTDHWLVGCDGGIYETWDAAKTWQFKANLPITQFYKVAVDNDTPFYNIYGGTQDNFSIGGPSRTNTSHGIVNSDWFITHGGDGFESQVDPENPDIVYAQSQYGVLVRYDRKSGEEVGIQPKERKGENGYRWNWDAPLQVSHHKSGRLYFAANKLFKSDDYGNSWEVLSDDLTRQLNRNELKIMDRVWSIDAVAKNRSTSPYGTIVAFSESAVDENLLVVGTDDGLIQISTDGGGTWKKVDNIAGVPKRSYVNSVYCSQHDANVIYAAFNHHKYGDFKPYIYKSTNKGLSWNKISNNLPERGSVYSIEEDHINKDLIFCGTEFGIFFSPNGGDRWKQIKAGVPTIAVRDIAIQRRENDLVLGTFGRGFYVLDDYSPLRHLNLEPDNKESNIFAVRDALMFEKAAPLGLPGKAFQGDAFYSGQDLGSVAIVDYYIGEEQKSLKDQRQKKESETDKENKDTPYPTYEDLLKEKEESAPKLLFTITNEDGDVVRKITKSFSKGLQRLKWDMRFASKDAISLRKPSFYNPFAGVKEGTLVAPGKYTIQMAKMHNGIVSNLGDAVKFNVKALDNTVMPADNREDKVDFQRDVAELSRRIEGAGYMIREMNNKMRHIKEAIKMAEKPMNDLMRMYNDVDLKIKNISTQFYGDNIKTRLDIDQPPTPSGRIGWINYEQKYSTSNPTETHKMSFQIAKEEFEPLLNAIKEIAKVDIENLEKALEDADAPYTPGRALKMID